MRCRACNALLTDNETVKRDIETDEFLDLCSGCLEGHEYAKRAHRETIILDTPNKPCYTKPKG